MVKRLFKHFLISLVLFFVFLTPVIAANVNPRDEFGKALQQGGLITDAKDIAKATPENAIGNIIGAVLTYIGVMVLVLVIYAGFLWATAQGNDQKIEKAKKILTGSVIGLIIIFSAAALVNLVIKGLGESMQ